MSAHIKVVVDAREITDRLQALLQQNGNLEPALKECGEIMRSSIEENFLSEGRYSKDDPYRGGTSRWQTLAAPTKAARAKKGKWPGKILQVSGQLASSISYNVTGNNLEIGSNKVYAAIQQLGGQTGRGGKVTIPSRPFLVIQESDIRDMVQAVDKHIFKD